MPLIGCCSFSCAEKCLQIIAVRKWRIENNGEILTKVYFLKVLQTALSSLDTKTIFEKGFKRCGLSPFDPNAINYSNLIKVSEESCDTVEKELSNSQNMDTFVTSKDIIPCIESKIDSKILEQFKNHNSAKWTGSTDLKLVYMFWLECKKDAHSVSSESSSSGTTSQNVQHPATNSNVVVEIAPELLNDGSSLLDELCADGNLLIAGTNDQLLAIDKNGEINKCDIALEVESRSASPSDNIDMPSGNEGFDMSDVPDETKIHLSLEENENGLFLDDDIHMCVASDMVDGSIDKTTCSTNNM